MFGNEDPRNLTCQDNSAAISCEYWYVSYMIFGLTFLFFGILYLIHVWRDLKSQTPKLPGYKISQIVYIVATLTKGIGWIVHSILIISNFKRIDLAQPATIGLPDYVLSISMCLIFFLWCSICANLLINDSSGFYEKLRNFLAALLITISILAFVSICTMAFNADPVLSDKAHIVEGAIATIRDLLTCILFLYYSIKIMGLLNKPLFSLKYNESVYCLMLFGLAAGFFVRCISIVVFLWMFRTNDGWSKGSFVNTVISAVFAEILPNAMIFFNRRRSGLLSVYDILE